MLLLALLCLSSPNSLITDAGFAEKRVFADPAETTDDYISQPYAATLSPDGRLYVTDVAQTKVLVWNADGSYRGSFGKQGEGPGEFIRPVQIHTNKDEVWIWAVNNRIHIFDLDGNYKTQFSTGAIQPWRFTVLNKDTAVSGYRVIDSEGKTTMNVALLPREGEPKTIMSWPHKGFISDVSGPQGNTVTIMSYLDDVDVQTLPNGNALVGFGQERILHEIDATGKVVNETRFILPRVEPTEEERDIVRNMSFPMGNGQRLTMEDLPGIKVQFNHPKGAFTQFMQTNDGNILFVLTPLGALSGIGNGYSKASWYLYSPKQGKAIKAGAYNYPEDSVLLFREGRIIGFIIDPETDEYTIRELELK